MFRAVRRQGRLVLSNPTIFRNTFRGGLRGRGSLPPGGPSSRRGASASARPLWRERCGESGSDSRRRLWSVPARGLL